MSDESVKDSYGVYSSRGVCFSRGVSFSYGVYSSRGVSSSYGVSSSGGVYYSYGVCFSRGVSFSYAVYSSRGVYSSDGVYSSRGVYNSLFVSNYKARPLLFNKEVTERRIDEVRYNYLKKCNGWYPKFNNAFTLYKENGGKWDFDASKITSRTKEEAWSDMPQEAINYLRSLPEFDEQIFFEVTGIRANTHKIVIDGKEIELSKESYENFKKQFQD